MTFLCPKLFTIWALKGLTAVSEERDILQGIWKALQGAEKDPVVKAISELQWGSSKSIQAAEWSELVGLLHLQGKIYVPKNPDVKNWIWGSI